jgi:hypothetical protein
LFIEILRTKYLQISYHKKSKTFYFSTVQEASMMIQRMNSSAAPPHAGSLCSRDSSSHLVEEEIQNSHRQQQQDNTSTREDDDSSTLSISAKKTLNQSQDIFRSNPYTSLATDLCTHEASHMPRACVVSFASDSDDYDTSDDDSTSPLDYHRDWSFEIQSTLKIVLRSNRLFDERNGGDELDDAMECDSIASIDVGSDYGDEINSPMSEWSQNDDIIW